ncbi:ATP-binding cassette domain-containing protein [Pinibacter aurantiacus]|uniref:ATP-binding cassette domain-containing protein n=1 Tax=Pinibacter aurantiacus TaxID=2851599 RepID=A0A9E2SFW9_9BACT|nr:ATP-binding cassette domain-containing protein [Pinibacter aurantiacus]MBV4360515.1 ATP-binding cassette domain-containing protein [Pinibacter aurantiacus]
MKHVLELDSIRLSFGERMILSDVYLKCETTKITALLGRNGQGKTSLFKIIYGELETQDKSIRFDGKQIAHPFSRPDLLRFLPQFNFVPGFLRLKRIFKDFELDFIEFDNRFPEFTTKLNQRVGNLSGGERRFLETYLILKSKTQFVILDEPFTHLMPLQIEKISQLMIEEKLNKGIILTDHLYNAILDIADTAYVLTNGKTHLLNNNNDMEEFGYLPATAKGLRP